MPQESISPGRRNFSVLFPDLAPPPAEEALAKLNRSLRLFGLREPVIVD